MCCTICGAANVYGRRSEGSGLGFRRLPLPRDSHAVALRAIFCWILFQTKFEDTFENTQWRKKFLISIPLIAIVPFLFQLNKLLVTYIQFIPSFHG